MGKLLGMNHGQKLLNDFVPSTLFSVRRRNEEIKSQKPWWLLLPLFGWEIPSPTCEYDLVIGGGGEVVEITIKWHFVVGPQRVRFGRQNNGAL